MRYFHYCPLHLTRKPFEILVETNVPGPAYALLRRLLRRGKGAACLGEVARAQRRRVPPRASFQQVDRVLPFDLAQDRQRTMLLEKVSDPVPACRDGELPS